MWERTSNGLIRTLCGVANMGVIAVVLAPAVAAGEGAAVDLPNPKVVFTGRKYEANHLFEIRLLQEKDCS